LIFGGGTPNRPLITYDICDGSGVVGVETDDSLEELDTLSLLFVIILLLLLSPRNSDCRRKDLSSTGLFDLLEDFVSFVLLVVLVELDTYNDVLREFVDLLSVDFVREVGGVDSTELDKYILLRLRDAVISDLAGETARDEATERAGETDLLGGNALLFLRDLVDPSPEGDVALLIDILGTWLFLRDRVPFDVGDTGRLDGIVDDLRWVAPPFTENDGETGRLADTLEVA